MKRIAVTVLFFLSLNPLTGSAQNPSTQSAPNFGVNSQWVGGIAPGYGPSKGSGLTLNLSAGSWNCGGAQVTYAGGTLSMTNTATNYIYLNASSSCVPASNTTGVAGSDVPIATVVAAGGVITTVTDLRLTGANGLPPWPTTPNGVPQFPCTTPSGSTGQPYANCIPGLVNRSVGGTTAADTILSTDSRVDYKGSVAVAVTLPTATTLGVPSIAFLVVNNTTGSGTAVTVTPTTWAIDRGRGAGAVATLVVAQNQSCTISVDAAGTQWDADCVTIN